MPTVARRPLVSICQTEQTASRGHSSDGEWESVCVSEDRQGECVYAVMEKGCVCVCITGMGSVCVQ